MQFFGCRILYFLAILKGNLALGAADRVQSRATGKSPLANTCGVSSKRVVKRVTKKLGRRDQVCTAYARAALSMRACVAASGTAVAGNSASGGLTKDDWSARSWRASAVLGPSASFAAKASQRGIGEPLAHFEFAHLVRYVRIFAVRSNIRHEGLLKL